MPERAHITSVEALEAFRENLIIYQSKARPTLEEVTGDVVRTRIWLENDQRIHWENQVRRRLKVLEQAQAALFSSRVSHLREASTAEQAAVSRAKRAVEEAEAKLQILKKWNREFGSQVEPLARQLEKLHTVLAHDIPKAAAHLTQVVNTLDAYANITPGIASPGPAPSSNAPAAESGPASGEQAGSRSAKGGVPLPGA